MTNSDITQNESSPISPKAIVGLILFLGTEVMIFGAFISSFYILRAGSHIWPPLDQPRLPVEITAINTLFLLFSGFTMYRAMQAIRQGYSSNSVKWLAATVIAGAIFLGIQGFEWVRLVNYGLTFTSSVYGATFYTLIGFHGIHVLGGMIVLLVVFRKSVLGKYTRQTHTGAALCSIYWYFVVGIWPILFIMVYLN